MEDAQAEPDAVAGERGPPKKRRRLVVSCTECHRRKQKCDRDLPCANCRSRNKEASCTYETGPGSKESNKSPSAEQRQSSSSTSTAKEQDDSMSSMAANWGYTQGRASTMGFLQRIEKVDIDGEHDELDGHGVQPRGARHDSAALKEKYKGLVRQLPSKTYLDKLIALFLQRFNWHYYAVDPDILYAQLAEWQQLPFKQLSSIGPQSLSPELRVFPAVLFQVVATALLVFPEGTETEFNALKYSDMTFEDLAYDYSESGQAIVALFGKKGLSTTTVQAEFLRAAFLKFTANVTESWHTLAVTIRDAQELGMHRDSMDPKPVDSRIESVLENQWAVQRRRKLYMILVIWDINMAIILGRPGGLDARHNLPTLPIDVPEPKDRSRTPVVPRDEDKDPPTALAKGLWLLQLTAPLREIVDLEQDGPYPKDFSKVDKIHELIEKLNDRKPGIFRLENADTRWDEYPGLQWLREVRYYFAHLYKFSIMALHRPYIFHRRESRVAALRASLQMLELQRESFEGLPPDSWNNYHLFYGSFDAIVLIASTYILFPREHVESRQSALQQFHWTIERFSAMQDRNPLARSAQGVLKAILAKLIKAISNAGDNTPTPASMRETTDSTPGASSTNKSFNMEAASSATASQLPTESSLASSTDWGMDAFASIAPMYPTSDLLFNDLNVIPDSLNSLAEQPPLAIGEPWQFGGGFGEDTVWQFLNQWPPSTSG